MRKTTFVLASCCWLLLVGCQADQSEIGTALDAQLEAAILAASNTGELRFFELPTPTALASIPQDPKNLLTPSKIELGKLLFHETGLALDALNSIGENTYSCASCHFASAGFQAGRFQGIAEGGIGFGINGEGRTKGALYSDEDLDVQAIRTPSVLNSAYQKNQLWNGQFGATGVNVGTEANWLEDTPMAVNHLGYEGLESQAIAGLTAHRLRIDATTLAALDYTTLFDEVFPDVPLETRYTKEQAALAIAAYERTLLATEAPFQQWLRGDKEALGEQEKRGAILFFGEANCVSCHTGPALNSLEFHALGLKDLYTCTEGQVFKAGFSSLANLGRASFTQRTEDQYKFKVPQLYNLADSPFYGHGSSFEDLHDLVTYKKRAIPENAFVPITQLANEFVRLEIDNGEVNDIVAFLERGLKDTNLERYVPSEILSGNCFPFNDPLAKSQLGCQ